MVVEGSTAAGTPAVDITEPDFFPADSPSMGQT